MCHFVPSREMWGCGYEGSVMLKATVDISGVAGNIAEFEEKAPVLDLVFTERFSHRSLLAAIRPYFMWRT